MRDSDARCRIHIIFLGLTNSPQLRHDHPILAKVDVRRLRELHPIETKRNTIHDRDPVLPLGDRC